ncbi:MAG: tetratricopeptide repeat protein [Hyphomonadaceae bacterium]|jgi:tetratricopeptide (TPR) repeat protein|nr:tetratricopeptide repeat protein [Hyphomonadaceae bacterium]
MRARSFAFLRIAPICALSVLASVGPASAAIGDEQRTETRSLLGSYLAGRLARTQNDTPAAASYYGKALQQDPDNEVLIEFAFQMEASEGNWLRAEMLARKLVAAQPSHRTARAFLGLVAFKDGRYQEAEGHFLEASSHPIGELTSALARAWIYQAQNKTQDALHLLDGQKLPDWAQYFLRYHRALLADVAGRTAEARVAYERMARSDQQRTLRIALAYASHAGHAGDAKLAQSILNTHLERTKGEGHPSVRALIEQIEAGRRPELLIRTPAEGLAEVFYGLGEALSGEGSVAVGVVLLQFSLYLTPDAMFPLVTLASARETTKRYAAAIDAYDRIPKGTPLEVNVEIRKALNLNQLERVDDAKRLLDALAQQHPRDIRPLEALGSIMRGQKRYEEAADYYTRAIALIDRPEEKHWTFYYSRGTCYERMKKLPQAEADLQKSLQLSPNQALTLNYLGYTWIDHNRNLQQGLGLIKKAVNLKPDDGYIVDSLGWAFYRLGNFKEAVKHLERAVELRPEDATLNDHLGDAYWRVKREREARFQWEQALTLKPEPEEAEKIQRKLERGLPPVANARQGSKRQVQRQERAKKRTEVNPASPFVQ